MFTNKKKKLEAIRNNWAKPIDKFRNFDLISMFHKTISGQLNNAKLVDNKTWKDLNLDDVFTIMDRNSSSIGQQYLYHSLHNYEKDKNILNEKIKIIEYFKSNSQLRESFQLELARLDGTNTYFRE